MTGFKDFYVTLMGKDLPTSIESMTLASGLFHWSLKRPTYLPAGVYLDPSPPSALPNKIVTVSLDPHFHDRVCPLTTDRIGDDPDRYHGLTNLLADSPFVRLNPQSSWADVVTDLNTIYGSIGTSRFLAHVAVDGFWDKGQLYVTNPDAIQSARMDLGPLRCNAPALPPAASWVQPDDAPLPSSIEDIYQSYEMVWELRTRQAVIQRHKPRQGGGGCIYTKKAAPFALAEAFFAFRAAQALGAPVPDSLCLRDGQNGMRLVTRAIPGPMLYDRPMFRTAYADFEIERAIDITALPWLLMDHTDLNDKNIIACDTPRQGPQQFYVIDSGGALRIEADGTPKTPARCPDLTDWDHPSQPWAITSRRKTRTPYAAGIGPRRQALASLRSHFDAMAIALEKSSLEIKDLGIDLQIARLTQASPDSVMRDLLPLLDQRLASAEKAEAARTHAIADCFDRCRRGRLWATPAP